ncbi:MAG TPA: alpha/beta hydrolase-fold protein, partial [Thermomicrobiales bacterium]|nr:alpha/beta hydrolase-fold protein [Thermomicrobiales bacterium]
YINWQESERLHRQAFETLITQDIPNHIRRHFWVTSGPWGIGGLSMGGYGAMRIGLKYPEQFASIWAHSSAFVISERLDPDLVDPAVIGDADVLHHAEHLIQNRGHVPTISFDCGVDDELIEDNRRVHAQLEKIGLPHTYAEHPGDHTWEYWDIHVQSALMQHVEVLCKSQQSRS